MLDDSRRIVLVRRLVFGGMLLVWLIFMSVTLTQQFGWAGMALTLGLPALIISIPVILYQRNQLRTTPLEAPRRADADQRIRPRRPASSAMGAQLVTVEAFNTPMEAHVARSFLDAEGIRTFLKDEQTLNVDPLLSVALGGVKLQVVAADYERARAVLDSLAAAERA